MTPAHGLMSAKLRAMVIVAVATSNINPEGARVQHKNPTNPSIHAQLSTTTTTIPGTVFDFFCILV